MKGNPELIDSMNALLKEELTAINQYMVHAEMAEDWGYITLMKGFKTRAITEMKHAERLIERILFLEGIPIVSQLGNFNIGKTVPEMVDSDHGLEIGAWEMYNKAIDLASRVDDHATRDILKNILVDEDHHIDELEDLQDEIEMMGLQVFLSTQM